MKKKSEKGAIFNFCFKILFKNSNLKNFIKRMGIEESKEETSHRDTNPENVVPYLKLSPFCDSPITESYDKRYGAIEFVDVGYSAYVFRKRLPFDNGRMFIGVNNNLC